MYLGRDDQGDLAAVKSDGTVIPFVQSDGGVTLGVATYYFPLGTGESPLGAQTGLESVHLKWAAAVAATITVETSNFPRKLGGTQVGQASGADDVTDYSSTAGNWIQENPTTAYVGVTGTGNSVTNLTVTAGGTNAGGCTLHLGNIGTKRCRIKVVTTVGGVVRCNVHGKMAG